MSPTLLVAERVESRESMGQSEHPALRDLRQCVNAVGEIDSVTTDCITINGIFRPGDAIEMRPGARVLVVTEEAALDIFGASS